MSHPKHWKFRNEGYLEWVRRQPSIIKGKNGSYDTWDMELGEGRNDPSHSWGTGKKGKRNDFMAVPLTREQHTQYHAWGHDTFEDIYKVDLMEEAFKHVCRYVQEITGESKPGQ